MPVIARVNGYALGGGMEMMLGCDVVVASADGDIGLPEPRVGRLALDGGIALLARRIAHVQAMGMLLTGRRVGAGEALRYGLINEVVAPDELDEAVGRWVADILACAPLSVRAIKQMVRAGDRVTAREAQMLRLPALIEALQSSDQDEGVSALRRSARPNGASAEVSDVRHGLRDRRDLHRRQGRRLPRGVFVSRTNGRLNDPYLDAAFS